MSLKRDLFAVLLSTLKIWAESFRQEESELLREVFNQLLLLLLLVEVRLVKGAME